MSPSAPVVLVERAPAEFRRAYGATLPDPRCWRVADPRRAHTAPLAGSTDFESFESWFWRHARPQPTTDLG